MDYNSTIKITRSLQITIRCMRAAIRLLEAASLEDFHGKILQKPKKSFTLNSIFKSVGENNFK